MVRRMNKKIQHISFSPQRFDFMLTSTPGVQRCVHRRLSLWNDAIIWDISKILCICIILNSITTDRPTDQPTDGRMDGQSLLQRCVVASKNDSRVVDKREPRESPTSTYFFFLIVRNFVLINLFEGDSNDSNDWWSWAQRNLLWY